MKYDEDYNACKSFSMLDGGRPVCKATVLMASHCLS